MTSDIAIARAARIAPIATIAAKLDLKEAALHPYGRYIAKLDMEAAEEWAGRANGKLILVTAISPTPAGEGKTTTTVGLGDGLSHLGRRSAVCLREPSLGPCFGMKGGAAGGGHAQVVPMEQINLHFTGDFHAITAAHNLLAAMLDNHIHWGNGLGIDVRRIVWRRVVDINDRALRDNVVALGGVANGFPRQSGFDITVSSEIMAVFCLARDIEDLQARLGRMVVAYRYDKTPVTADDLMATGAMTVLLKDAFAPNLVQTLEGTPAFVHGGPFANIAHGCNSRMATETALKLADYVVTEAGFGADLGAEKFFDIKCRIAGLAPDVVVLVATVRALKMHGGVDRTELGRENLPALAAGLVNLERHLANLRRYNVPVVVAINHFGTDTEAELQLILTECAQKFKVEAYVCRHWAHGSRGITDLAQAVLDKADGDKGAFQLLYPDAMPLLEKIRTVAQNIYGAADINASEKIRASLAQMEAQGFGHLPVCIAKTQYSFSTEPTLRGAPSGHIVPIREVRLSAGAGFVVVICGDIMTMPGLPRHPAAEHIYLDAHGDVQGLF
ncbi:MAG: formate--tetrahydrofolate ligase [Hyphomicrobiales bacterium]|nr:formate--tetrahydrofolate ligase [Hyphomicrobiales bacterium]MDE2113700.1 formate--tetrahydrofolate ligase [Hyphomicrobiales bacterium]